MKLLAKPELDTKKKLLVLGWFNDKKDYYKELNPTIHNKIQTALKNKTFTEKLGSTLKTMINESMYEEVLVVSIGSAKELTSEGVRRALSKGVNHCKSLRIKGFTTNIAELATPHIPVEKIGLSCGESALLSSYSFIKYTQKAKEEVKIEEIVFSWKEQKTIKKFTEYLVKGQIIGEATNYAKDLINEPACVAHPKYLEEEAKKLAKNSNLTLKVLNRKELEKKGMNLLVAVGKGSAHEPRMLIFDYKGSPKKPDTVLLGKGITFDTGGYNIKPTGYMEEMKQDMGGAAAVLGTIKALTMLKPKISVSFIVPLAENMISSKAYRPSDIVQGYNKKTVEVLNTDAEGRLILADALSFAAEKYKGARLIDIATLTGAAAIATGHVVAPMVGNNSDLLSNLKRAGDASGDRVWEFPFYEDYQDWMDSDIADVSNISKKNDRYAGMITGGVFLSKFINDSNWVHIDIGGTAYLKEAAFYNQKYATGAGVRLFCYYLNNF